MAGFAQEHTEHDGEDNTRDPEDAALAEVGDVILRAGKTLAEQIGENGSDQRGHSEGKEVNSPCRASFDLVRIHFLDDRVWNHRGARRNAE